MKNNPEEFPCPNCSSVTEETDVFEHHCWACKNCGRIYYTPHTEYYSTGNLKEDSKRAVIQVANDTGRPITQCCASFITNAVVTAMQNQQDKRTVICMVDKILQGYRELVITVLDNYGYLKDKGMDGILDGYLDRFDSDIEH